MFPSCCCHQTFKAPQWGALKVGCCQPSGDHIWRQLFLRSKRSDSLRCRTHWVLLAYELYLSRALAFTCAFHLMSLTFSLLVQSLGSGTDAGAKLSHGSLRTMLSPVCCALSEALAALRWRAKLFALAITASDQAYRRISTGQLSTLLRLHLRPIDVVVYHGPQGDLVLRGASRLDAFSGYPVRT